MSQPDLLDMLAEMEREPYAGPAPLAYTVTAFTVEEYLAAEHEYRRVHGNFGLRVGPPHLWLVDDLDSSRGTPGHAMSMMCADLGCDNHYPEYRQPRTCQCVGDRVYRSICECGVASGIVDHAGTAIAEWHDHAWPGWRDLPVMPIEMRQGPQPSKAEKQRQADWLAENYPATWGRDGAPMVTQRDGFGTRSVPSYSPWGGFDISKNDRDRQVAA